MSQKTKVITLEEYKKLFFDGKIRFLQPSAVKQELSPRPAGGILLNSLGNTSVTEKSTADVLVESTMNIPSERRSIHEAVPEGQENFNKRTLQNSCLQEPLKKLCKEGLTVEAVPEGTENFNKRTLQNSCLQEPLKKLCKEGLTMEEAAEGKNAWVPKENILWSAKAAFQMLALYEARKDSVGYSKCDKKFWQKIADDLNADSRKLFSRDVEWKHVKDKFHNLKTNMNGKRDWNRNSGNDPKKMTVLEERAEEIIHGKKDDGTGTEYVPEVQLQTFCLGTDGNGTSDKEDIAPLSEGPGCSSTALSTPRQKEVSGRYRFKPKRKHGSGSNAAKTKLQLEKQWLAYLQQSQESFSRRAVANAEREAFHKDLIRAKDRKNELAAKYLEQKEKHMKKKEDRFRKKVELETERNRLLAALVDSKSTTNF